MAGSDSCPKCGKQLPKDAPAGLCPSCLFAEAFEQAEPDSGPGRFHSPTTPGPIRFVPPSVSSLSPLFPQLEILGLLGHGGMGAVYKARQKKLDRLVALKIIRPEAAADPAFAERFNREARTLARLSHPHIVAVHDFGEVAVGVSDQGGSSSGPLFYFLMEYVDGANLRQLMDGARLEPSQSLAIVPQVCEALQFAHDEGIIHRDIKPENILLDSRGRVKIADFGLAKLVVGGPDEFTLTGTHQVMGTPRYMAPEQMEGSPSVDHRADIYSLGVVFYEMLTGQVPAGHFEPPSKKAAIPPGLDAVVLRAMARDPERRFQQASEFRSEMKQAQSASPLVVSTGSAFGDNSSDEQGFPAISSMLSRETMAAWQWIAGPVSPTAKPAVAPRWLMFLLSLAACATMFFPWFDIYVTDLDATRGLNGIFLVQFENTAAFHREIAPLELTSGVLCGIMACLLLIAQVTALGRPAPSRSAAVTGLAMCGLALTFLMLHRYELWFWKVTVFGDPATGAVPQSALSYGQPPGVGDSYLGPLHHVVRYQAAFLAVIGSLAGLLCLLGMELRHALTSPQIQQVAAVVPQLRLVASVRRWLIAATVVLMISAIATSVFVLDDPYALDESVRSRSTIVTNLLVLVAQGLCFPVAVLTIVAVVGLKQGHYRHLAITVCILLLVPCTPAWLFTMPVAALCLAVLCRPDVRRSFNNDESKAVAKNVSELTPLERMAFWLQAAGVVTVCSAAVTLVLVMGSITNTFGIRRGDEEFLLTLCGFQILCLPLAVTAFVVANGLRQGQHLSLAKATCILLLVPCTPSWIVTMPVAVWCLSTLQRKEIASAFQDDDGVFEPPTAIRPSGFPWGWLTASLMVQFACFGLILFAQAWLNSAWVLIALPIIWVCIGVFNRVAEKTPLDPVTTVITVIGIPLTLGLIGYGIWQSQKAWPLLVVIAVFLAFADGLRSEDEEAISEDNESTDDDAEETTEIPTADDAGPSPAIQSINREADGVEKIDSIPKVAAGLVMPSKIDEKNS